MSTRTEPKPMPVRLTRENVRDVFPCFQHYSVSHCSNLGFLRQKRNAAGVICVERCPLEHLCKKEAYIRNSEVYESGQIDKPRELIRRLDK